MKANTKKFKVTYLRVQSIVCLLDNRIDSEMATWTRNDLMKEYKKLTKRLTKLSFSISEPEFELLGDMCMEYEEFLEPWDNEYVL